MTWTDVLLEEGEPPLPGAKAKARRPWVAEQLNSLGRAAGSVVCGHLTRIRSRRRLVERL
jgi:hypothetical protein